MPAKNFLLKPRIGISSCLLGQKVRYDGAHKRDAYIVEILGKFFEWVPVCPELEVGMGVPRESVRLVGDLNNPRMVGERSGRDWTRDMERFSLRRTKELETMQLSGYILKKNSPSCGMERVRVYGKKGMPVRQGRGLFATALIRHLPSLPIEEEGRLNDPSLRENFIERVFAYHRWQGLIASRPKRGGLVDFHTRHKFLLLAHGEPHYRQLGRLVAESKRYPLKTLLQAYASLFMEALAVRATVRKHTNVLEHMSGYFSKRLTPEERAELIEIIRDYRRALVPLIVPLTLIRHYVRKYQVSYLAGQFYLDPDPKELMLRNHV